jgi:hypothetical protein
MVHCPFSSGQKRMKAAVVELNALAMRLGLHPRPDLAHAAARVLSGALYVE